MTQLKENLKPIRLYNAPSGMGPNPWKVHIILLELGLPHKMEWVRYGALKQEPYLSLNPNGRVPSIEDPNTGVAIFESGACIEYLIDTYDKDNILGYDYLQDRYLLKSWLFFQCSGQGPYWGQKSWFVLFHNEKLPSAIERYSFETKRILGVIELALRKQQQEKQSLWLVGDKCTYADLSFVTWNTFLERIFPGDTRIDIEKDFPLFHAWHDRMMQRESVKEVFSHKKWANENLRDSASEVPAYIPRAAGGTKT